MQYDVSDVGHEMIATLDIETTGYDPDTSETVAIVVGVHERAFPWRKPRRS